MPQRIDKVIGARAIIAESHDRMKGKLWSKVRGLVNETFQYIHQFAVAQGLDKSFPILCGPYHFYISLDEEEGLVIMFCLRASNEPQRIYALDISAHSIINVQVTLEHLPKDHAIFDPKVIRFWPWEFDEDEKLSECAKLKALEFVSAISREIGKHAKSIPDTFEFPQVDLPVDEKLVFVLMPFGEKWSNRIWKKHLRLIIANSGLTPKRADDLYGLNVIQDIWRSIKQAHIVVADVTGRNPNVYYEVGIAHALRKPTIIITQSADDIPFDLRSFRHIIYQDNSDGYEILEKLIPKTVDHILKKYNSK